MEIQSYLKEHRNLFGVFGFGSFFRDSHFNDIDLLVVVNDRAKQPLDDFYKVKACLDSLSSKLGIPIDITFLNYTEYSRKPLLESNRLVPIVATNICT